MRPVLAFSIAAAIPAMLSVSAAEAQTRPAPPSAGAHGRGSASPRTAAHVRPAPPPGAVVRDTSAPSITPGGESTPADPKVLPLTPAATTPQEGAVAPSAPSASPAGGQAAQGPTRLTLSSVVGSAAPRTVTLQCDPVGGTHPKAAQACADLAKARDNFTVAPDEKNPQACFMIYSPVTASAEGQWRGEAVKFTTRFPNTCVLHSRTASIFDF
jgi:hypothetical protein